MAGASLELMSIRARIERFEIVDEQHGTLPAVALCPAGNSASLPVSLFLYGGGGQLQTLLSLEPLLAPAWQSGKLPPLFVACAGVPPFCFYLDDAERGQGWQKVVSERLLDEVRARFPRDVASAAAGIVGVSMGGYGALKMAFDRPRDFGAVAALVPMLEPDAKGGAPLRNRFHYPPAVPQALLGEARDRGLFERDHPITRARRNADEIRAAELAIWIEAGSRDELNAHDGAEALHRELWRLDIPHEYHLRRDAGHIGPDLPRRLLAAFRWVGEQLRGVERVPGDEERALAQYLEPLRAAAYASDESLARTYGKL